MVVTLRKLGRKTSFHLHDRCTRDQVMSAVWFVVLVAPLEYAFELTPSKWEEVRN